jgi:o-succinylbenzoate---CoA ligase
MSNWLSQTARQKASQTAMSFAAEIWTFAQMEAEAISLACKLGGLGVTVGSRVAVLMDNHPHYVILIHALAKLGAIAVLINTRLTETEILWQLEDCEVNLLVHDAARSFLVEEISLADRELDLLNLELVWEYGDPLKRRGSTPICLLDDIDLNAVQAIIYTSGTSGKPKGVQLTYGNHFHSAIALALNLGIKPDDHNWLICMPLYHVGGLSIIWRSAIYGIGIVLHQRFEPEAVIEAVKSEQVTIISLVPTMLTRILAHDSFKSSLSQWQKLRCILLGGAAPHHELLEQCCQLRLPIAPTYGLTEAASHVTTLLPHQVADKLGASGGTNPFGNRLRIISIDREQDHAQELPPNQVGQILVKGKNVMAGYVNRPHDEVINDGWLHTGDLGYLDSEGFLYVVSRRSDLIVSGGENIYPAEIESILTSHPQVEEACVVGISDREWGQIVAVAIASQNPPSLEEIREFCRKCNLASYKLPKALYLVNSIPKTASGKLCRQEVQSMIAI